MTSRSAGGHHPREPRLEMHRDQTGGHPHRRVLWPVDPQRPMRTQPSKGGLHPLGDGPATPHDPVVAGVGEELGWKCAIIRARRGNGNNFQIHVVQYIALR
mgnify:CR=1 FL=1